MKKVVIIGSGPGGYYGAIKLAKSGFQVTIIEKKKIGGTCLNVGCIPTKVLLDHISLNEHLNDAVRKKTLEGTAQISQEGLRKYQLDVIKQLSGGLEKLFQKEKINLLYGEAKLVSDNQVLVKQENQEITLEADEIIIATGSNPRSVPTFTIDGKQIVSSDDIWNIPTVPKNMLVVGSGPIGIEFARVFNRLGTKVTISEIKESICPILDLGISENLVRSLKRRGITVKPNAASKFVEKKDLVKVEFLSTTDSKKETGEFEMVLVAVGRKPNTENLGLEAVGVELAPGGFIKTNELMQTNIKHVWAIGDITNHPQLAHTASYQARVVSENILGKKAQFDPRFIPSCIFGYPEIAFVGDTEEMLKEKKASYRAGKFLFLASGKAKASGLTEGLVKVLMDKSTNKILGAHIIGPEASTLIHEMVIAMQNDLTVDQLAKSIHAHPTYSEVIMEALEDCLGEAVHV